MVVMVSERVTRNLISEHLICYTVCTVEMQKTVFWWNYKAPAESSTVKEFQ